MRRSFLATFASFAAVASALGAPPLGCATGLRTGGDDVGGAGGQGGAATVSVSVSASKSASSGSSACDNTGTCATCRTCAISAECSSVYDTCVNDSDCLDYNACIEPCTSGDDACFDACASLYPFGEQEFFEYAFCLICTACYTDCEGTVTACQ